MAPKKSLPEVYQLFFANLFNFKGRTRRSDYWPVVILNSVAVSVVSGIISGIASGIASSSGSTAVASIGSAITSIISLAVSVLELGLVVRRLHDTGKEWTYMLLALIPFVGWIIVLIPLLKDSDPGDNQFGPNPKGFYADPNGYNQGFAPQQQFNAQQAYAPQPQDPYAPQAPAYNAAPQPQEQYIPQPQAPVEPQPVYTPQPQAPFEPQPVAPVEQQAPVTPQFDAQPAAPVEPQAPVMPPIEPQAPVDAAPQAPITEE
ncbi:MAG: DUF805 domain-containing protein [Eubacterium sp.]|nr:DUF805 domain-containing protein [Eubacterium sp.]